MRILLVKKNNARTIGDTSLPRGMRKEESGISADHHRRTYPKESRGWDWLRQDGGRREGVGRVSGRDHYHIWGSHNYYHYSCFVKSRDLH